MFLTLLVAQLAIVTPAQKIPAAEALAILARMDSTSNWTNRFTCRDCDGPRVTVVPYYPNDGPFGPFPVYALPSLVWSMHHGGSPYYDTQYSVIHSSRANVYRSSRGASAPGRMSRAARR